MSSIVDVTSTIERLEALEERLGVSLEDLSAFVHDQNGDFYIYVCGDLQPRNGAQLQEHLEVEVEATVYDSNKRIIGTSSREVSVEKIIGFEAFEVGVRIAMPQVSKVRVYPKKG